MVGGPPHLFKYYQAIRHLVHVLSQFMQDPDEGNWHDIVRLLDYLKSSPSQGIFLSTTSSLDLYVYYDSDWANYPMSYQSVLVILFN